MKVEIAEYDPGWPGLFAQERDLLVRVLGPSLAAVEHIGSTSVPRLAAKPVIDIMVGLYCFLEADGLVPRIEAVGYTYVSEYEDVIPQRRFFRKVQHGIVTHHIHMVEVNSAFWERHLLFRDYLRENPDVAAEYALLKKDLAKREWRVSNDFAEAKSRFIRRIEEQARISRRCKS